MNHTYKAILLTAGALCTSFSYASTAALSLTNETVKGDINVQVGPFGINGGVTHDQDENSSIAYIGASLSNRNGDLETGVGLRFYVVDTDTSNDEDELSGAGSVGGWYRYTFNGANRISFYNSFYYSPEVFTLNELDHMYTYDVRIEYMATPAVRTYINYGNTVTVYDDGSRSEINKGFSVGGQVDF